MQGFPSFSIPFQTVMLSFQVPGTLILLSEVLPDSHSLWNISCHVVSFLLSTHRRRAIPPVRIPRCLRGGTHLPAGFCLRLGQPLQDCHQSGTNTELELWLGRPVSVGSIKYNLKLQSYTRQRSRVSIS